jgi:hypothetical protein
MAFRFSVFLAREARVLLHPGAHKAIVLALGFQAIGPSLKPHDPGQEVIVEDIFGKIREQLSG